ncbi:MAG: DNA primase [Eubacteriales bacterium]|uniref:DNA primase n=1 Tax=Fenollaria sp. TaxID=1965292 RepID=UPI002A75E955|nr:DNA primase [Fenollaria sp.]MDD7339117.1 DNA primase [Eubacteriales bacterium]MDY3105769.1 DNA primase [Fenollaria sp.]
MKVINAAVIDKIKEFNNIEDVIGENIKLEKKGTSYTGLCPFHKEKTPSFHVNSKDGYYKCFGCGEAGDVITFIEKYKNYSFQEAVEYLADRANITLQEATAKKKTENDLIEKFYDINKTALDFFQNQILKSKIAIDYLMKRKLNKDTVLKYQLGYAPNEWTALKDYLLSKGYDENFIIRAGLAKRKEGKDSSYDTFRNRLVFPIVDSHNHVLGFSARSLDNSMPKYLNTSENIVFKKRELLFGYNIYKKEADRDKILLVEGNIDVMSLYQAGVNYAVANLGTAFTINQANLLKRNAKKIYICYDGDKAGKNATHKAIEILRSIDAKANVVELPEGLDPDDYIKKYGLAGFTAKINEAKNSVEYEVSELMELYDVNDPESLLQLINELSDLLSKINDKIEREIYIDYISRVYSIDKRLLTNQVSKTKYVNNYKEKYTVPEVPRIKKLDIEIIDENLLIYALADIKYFKYINKEISIDNYSKVFKVNMPLLKSKYEGNGEIELDDFDLADKENALLEIDSIRKKSEESTYMNLEELLVKREKLKSKDYVSVLLSQINDGKSDAMELLKLIKKQKDNE